MDTLVRPGFVTEAVQPPDPPEPTEVLTIEVPRRLKRALLAEVADRKDDPQRRTVASMKSVILEALTAYGFSEFISKSDIEVQAGIFMKRQAAQLRSREGRVGEVHTFRRLTICTHGSFAWTLPGELASW